MCNWEQETNKLEGADGRLKRMEMRSLKKVFKAWSCLSLRSKHSGRGVGVETGATVKSQR